jgi:archaellum component FlaC
MLFRVPAHNQNPFDANPAAKAIKEFAEMTPKMFRALILFADYKSPLRQKPRDERFKLACMQAGYRIDSAHQHQLEKRARELFYGDNKYWEAGYKKYMEIQHDEDRDILNMVDAQIENIKTLMSTKTEDVAELDKRNKMIINLPQLVETKRRLSRLMDKEEEIMGTTIDEEAETDRKLSWIDQENSLNQVENGNT